MNKISLYYDSKKIVIWAETTSRFKILKQYEYNEKNLQKSLKYMKGLEKNDYIKKTIYKSI